MPTLITAGIDYPQFQNDLRALIRHELTNAPAAPVGNAAPADELLTVREAAALLDVTVQTAHEWKRRGILPYEKMGSRTYFVKSKVLAALQGHQRTVKTGKGVPRG